MRLSIVLSFFLGEKMKNSFITLIVALCISTLFLYILLGINSIQSHNKEIEYEEKIKNLEYQLKTATESFERQVDTCLDIVVNQRWN